MGRGAQQNNRTLSYILPNFKHPVNLRQKNAPSGKFKQLKIHENTAFSNKFFNPIFEVYSSSDKQYRRPGISDINFRQLSTVRCIISAKTGKKTLDPLAQFSELDNWEVNLVDGHYQKSASFDPKYLDSKGNSKSIATGHFFRMDLRNQHLSFLDLVKPEDGKKKAHDVTVIRRSEPNVLRNGAAKGRKMMLFTRYA